MPDNCTMKYVSLALLLIAFSLTGGCAPYVNSSSSSATSQSDRVLARSDALDPMGDIRPEVREQALLLYHILAGEIGGYQNQLGQAVENYLEAITETNAPDVAKRATQIALFANDYASATVAARRWVELAPNDVDGLRTLAILYLRAGELQQSMEQMDKVVALAKGDKETAFHLVSRLLAHEEDKQSALKVMGMLAEKHNNAPEAQFAYAQLAAEFGQLDAARSSIEKALKAKPDWPDARLLQARILMQQGETERALKSMAAVVKANPESKVLRVSYARLLAEAKRYDQAKEQFELLLKQHPKDSELLYALALLAMENKQYDSATRYLKRLAKSGKHTGDAYYYLGAVAETQKQYDQAIRWYSKVHQGERVIDAHIRVASLMAKKGNVEEARNYLHRLQPRDEELAVRMNVAETDILTNAGRYQEAMDVINQGLAQMPDSNDLLYARAILAEKMDRLDLLERDLKTILVRDPDNYNALNALGYTLADRTKRYEEALGYIKKALELAPEQPAILDSMGWVQFRLGNMQEAVNYLRNALELDPDPEIAAHLGEVLWVMGNRSEAEQVWGDALKGDPNNEILRDTVKRLKKQ
jgi:tetratricopeptide (TPR) repeat protein